MKKNNLNQKINKEEFFNETYEDINFSKIMDEEVIEESKQSKTINIMKSNSQKNLVVNQNRDIIEDANQINDLQKQHKEIDINYQNMLKKKWNLSEQITNRSMFLQVQKSRKMLFNTSADYRIKFYKTVLDGRLEALSEKTNTGLMMIKSHYREQVAAFMMEKMHVLTKEVNFRQQEFMNLMMEKHDYVATLENYPSLKEQYLISILLENERYMNFLDRLIIRFENIIDEQLKKYTS